MSEEDIQIRSKQKIHSNNTRFLLIGIAILIIILILVGAYFLNNSKNSKYPDESALQKDLDASNEVVVDSSIQASYVCADSKTINATFNNGEEPSVDLVLSDGNKMTLPRVESASGGKYANEDQSIVFWNGGNDAYLEENAVKTYTNCTTGS